MTIFICPKDILFDLNKCYLIRINLLFESKRVFQTNYFISFNQIFFPICYGKSIYVINLRMESTKSIGLSHVNNMPLIKKIITRPNLQAASLTLQLLY